MFNIIIIIIIIIIIKSSLADRKEGGLTTVRRYSGNFMKFKVAPSIFIKIQKLNMYFHENTRLVKVQISK